MLLTIGAIFILRIKAQKPNGSLFKKPLDIIPVYYSAIYPVG